MNYEEMVSKINTEIWDNYFEGIITWEQLEKLLKIYNLVF